MSETLDHLYRSLQGVQLLTQEKKVTLLDRVGDGLRRGVPGSSKALEGIITAIAPILGSSQVIACQAALSCVQPLIERVTREANMHASKSLLHFVLPQLLDRLGDGRMAVRELALATLMSMWAELDGMQSRKASSERSQSPGSPTRSNGSRYSAISSSIPKFGTPFKSRVTKPSVPVSPTSLAHWSPSLSFEREIQTRGFGHKIWRVREMILEWLHTCVEEYPEFPAMRYIENVFGLLDDNQDAVRFASKRALNTIYNARPEFQEDIVSRAQPLASQRPTLLLAITAPKGELAALPASPYGGGRSGSRLGASQIGRPGSRVSGSSRHDMRPPPFSTQMQPPMPPPPHIPAGNAFRPTNHRSMSQQGLRPGSRTGFTSPLSPGRPSQLHSQQMHHHSPLHSSSGIAAHGPASAGAAYSPSHQQPASGSPPSQAPGVTSSLTNRQSSRILNPRRPLRKQPSLARLPESFVPSQNLPADVKVHNVPSKQSLASEFARTIGSFGGRETEDNWVHRERAVNLYRGIVWGNAAIEFHEDLVAGLKEHIFEILKAVSSLRTSMSFCAMGLCDDIAMRLGPYAAVLLDPIFDALLKQCAQTKKLGAQRAAKSLEVMFRYFPLRAKSVEALRLRMADKSAVLRLAMVTTCTSILRSHGQHLDSADRRNGDILTSIDDVIKLGVVDAQPSVRESSRELFWELHTVSELHGKKLLSGFPENTRTALLRDKVKYVREGQQSHSRLALQDARPMSAASIFRTPSGSHGRQAGMRPSFGGAREASGPSLMSVVAASHSPQRSPTAARSSYSSDTDLGTPLANRTGVRQMMVPADNHNRLLEEPGETEADRMDEDDDGMDEDMLMFVRPTHEAGQGRKRVQGLRTPVQPRMSLGLIDFNQVDMGGSLLEADTPPRGSLLTNQPSDAMDTDVEMGDVSPVVSPTKSSAAPSIASPQVPTSPVLGESQATAVAGIGSIEQSLVSLGSIQNLSLGPEAGPDSPTPARDHSNDESTQMDEDEDQVAGQVSGMVDLKERRTSDAGSISGQGHFLTPERTPRMSPSLKHEARALNAAPMSLFANQMATPRTQTARYWLGPMDMTSSTAMPRPSVAESPMPAETPVRLNKIDLYLKRLSANDDVDESLFRSLARFAKDESNTSWVSEEAGGSGYLDRILRACLCWLQAPVENRDTVFVKDSCFDVLRVLVRRKSQHFTLDTARLLLLEVLRNRFIESTILSGSAEDVFYDMATHLDADLCFELSEDFFRRAPIPTVHDTQAGRPGYAAHLESSVETAADVDPMGVYKMDNALAGVLEFVAEVVKHLPSPEMVTMQDLDKFMPYSTACFIHPRSQVRKAALEPIIMVHTKLGKPDSEFEELLLRASSEQLATSSNPLAKYIDQLRRPELRKLVWSFYLSRCES
ncbi:suppressor of tub2 mutation [Coemansia interrupta]|uniref:Suppressor of tub2 mutation n=1 Tax=Coemansia interrupta TaxID=1126814 RepID=A0A9W8HPN9_9FUNG|nr:suppressor of tub2 mutation [Coemansia interrupta]